jgi:pilus assembly protein CpaB
MTRAVVSNVQVLTAGTKYDQASKDGKPIPSSVVTLMVLPDDAERIALASNEGKITLVLRNPLDVAPTDTKGVRLAALMRGTGPEPVIDPVRNRVVARKPAPAPAAPVPAPVYTVEAIRAAKRSAEVVR